MLKTAHILKQMGVDFEWKVAGKMSYNIREVVEKKENLRFEDNNIEILGLQKLKKGITWDKLMQKEKICKNFL